ncbi:MAG: hypothetical protein AAF089_00795 [Bacteroidota bacterium]
MHNQPLQRRALYLERRLLRVTITDDAKLATENTITDLMGKDAAPRFQSIMGHADEVEELDV